LAEVAATVTPSRYLVGSGFFICRTRQAAHG
jgi:hypothetical protein